MKNPVIRMKALNNNYYTENLNGQVRLDDTPDTIGCIDGCLNMGYIFGENRRIAKGITSAETGNYRGYIKLDKPIMNKLMFGTDLHVIKQLLNIDDKTFKQIVDFSKGYNLKTESLTNDFSGCKADDILFYGDYFKYRIENMDMEEARKYALKLELKTHLYPATCSVDNIGEVFNIDRDFLPKGLEIYPVMANYVFAPNPSQQMKRDITLNITADIMKKCFKHGTERFLILLNTTKEVLLNGINSRVSVLPLDLRPKICGRFDPITGLYNTLMLRNKFLSDTLLTGGSVEEVKLAYKYMVEAHDRLCYKGNEREPEKKPMYEKLKGKKGFLRSKVMSKRADYSGRSVVVVNPKLKIDQCGLPVDMIPKLFREHYLKSISDNPENLKKFLVQNDTDKSQHEQNIELTNEIKALGLLDKINVNINRAPTLHKNSYVSYNPIVSKSRAIEVHPLISEGQNMDFDGDTSATNVPTTENGIREVNTLMSTIHNLFKPSNGSCLLTPRMDMLLGLWVLTRDYTDNVGERIPGDFSDYTILKRNILNQDIQVNDKIFCNGKMVLAGKALIWLLLPDYNYEEIPVISKKTIKAVVEKILERKSITYFSDKINELVEIGFELATLYPPTITLFTAIDKKEIQSVMQNFHDGMEKATVLFESGFDESDNFNQLFADNFSKADTEIEDKILESLSLDNGFKQMVDSGARGDKSNLIQIYSHKGLIAGSNGKTFRAVIENSLSTQLTSLEHFIAAYGSRKGLMDKSIKPAETGYAERLMAHSTSAIVITCDDCGTTDTLLLTKNDISRHLDEGEDGEEEINKVLQDILIGRNIVVNKKVIHITKQNIDKILREHSSFNLRSPLKCKNPCCSVCYGTDLSIRGKAAIGTPVGFMAGQSIGEPGTQLTMKSFQKGGIAKKGSQVTDFDKIDALLKCQPISQKREEHPNYDPLAWASGDVEEYPCSTSPDLKVIKIKGSLKSLTVDKDAMLKPKVIKGENLCIVEGEYDITEIQEYKGSSEAAKYLSMACYMTYRNNASVNIKHFEVLASGMVLYLVYSNGGNKNIKPGQYYTGSELSKLTDLSDMIIQDNNYPIVSLETFKTNVVVSSIIKGVKKVPLLKAGVMSNIMLEDLGAGARKAILFQSEDNFNEPLPLLILGKKPSVGTYFPNYIENRLQNELRE